jgi:glycosyltransferase involved in cell wall biosynthesis
MSKREKTLVSILMPVYNEQVFLSRIVSRVLDAPLPDGCRRELIMVDDGSTDGSKNLMEALKEKHPRLVRLFFLPTNRGKGAAISRAVEEMRGDIAIIQDADLEYDPVEYPRLLEPILTGRADVVYGSRFLGYGSRRVLNYHHAVGNSFLTHLSNMTTGLNLTDMETCYKVYKADVLRTIPIRSRRFGIEPEITAKVAKRDCVVYEVPISYHGRSYSEGKKIGWRDGLEAFGVILKYWFKDDCYSDDRFGHYILQSLSHTRRFSSWIAKAIEPHLGARILEIGSGIGNISRQLPKRELLTLSDTDVQYQRLLKQAFGAFEMVEVIGLDLCEDQSFAKVRHTYDSIVCLNVLEHIEDDQAALKRMASLLAPGGRLILQVPQYNFLMSELDGELGHFRRYDADELDYKLAQAGLDVVEVKNFNALGALGWLFSAKMMKRKSLGRYQLKFFDMLVPLQQLTEKHLPLPGLSLVGVGQKPRQ